MVKSLPDASFKHYGSKYHMSNCQVRDLKENKAVMYILALCSKSLGTGSLLTGGNNGRSLLDAELRQINWQKNVWGVHLYVLQKFSILAEKWSIYIYCNHYKIASAQGKFHGALLYSWSSLPSGLWDTQISNAKHTYFVPILFTSYCLLAQKQHVIFTACVFQHIILTVKDGKT